MEHREAGPSALCPVLVERRQGERRRGLAAPAPTGRERRRGDRRRLVGALALGTVAISTSMASSALAGGRPTPVSSNSVSDVPSPDNPLAGLNWYVDPNSSARRQADAWRPSRPADAAQLDKIAAGSQADWFGDWSGDVLAAVDARVSTAAPAGQGPALVADNIPHRD